MNDTQTNQIIDHFDVATHPILAKEVETVEISCFKQNPSIFPSVTGA